MTGTITTLDRGYDELPIPFGWFAVALSNEIQNGDIKTMRYFGTEFVVWRGGLTTGSSTVMAWSPRSPTPR